MRQGYGLPHPCFPALTTLENTTSRNMQRCHAKAMLCSESDGSTSAPERTAPYNRLPFEGCWCWCGGQSEGCSDKQFVRTNCTENELWLPTFFFALAAKLHFICILSMAPVSALSMLGLLLSTDRVAMRILCVQIAYYVKTLKITNPISSCLSRVT